MGHSPDDASPEARSARTTLPLLRGVFLVLSSFVVLSLVLSLSVTSRAEPGADTEDPDYPELFQQIDQRLEYSYLDLDRVQPRPLVERALSSLELAAEEIYVDNADPEVPVVPVHVDDRVEVFDLNRLHTRKDSITLLEKLFRFVGRHYKGESTLNELRYAAANGFLSGIDPHTIVFTPKNFEEFEIHIRGEIFGVGMIVGASDDGRLEVKQVLKETPAFRAGFLKGDKIEKIGDESTINMSVLEAVQKIRGPRGTPVVLTVKRKSAKEGGGVQTIPISVKRDRVRIKSVESKLIKEWPAPENGPWKGGIGYIKVTSFDQQTTTSLVRNLGRLRRENGARLAGLILDLRGNSGGLLTQAVAMSDYFLRKGDIVLTARKGDILQRTQAEDDGFEPEFPMILLADEGSASGAEIVLGALQKNDRALVLGTRTFGKGSVQQLQRLSHGAQLKITVSEYLLPGEVSIQENGVVPDILAQPVVLREDITDLFPTEHIHKERDYEAHLVSTFQRKEEPKVRLKYLYELSDDETTTPSERFISGEIEPEKDSLVRMALDLFALADRPWSPSRVLENRGAEIDALGRKYFARIVEELGELGIDWSTADGAEGPRPGELELELSSKVIEEPSEDKDDKVPVRFLVVTAKAKNTGPRTLYRIKGITLSDYRVLQDREFLFGKLGPGASVERTRKIRLPYFTRSQESRITLGLSGPDNKKVTVGSAEVRFDAHARPSFAYRATLKDGEGKSIERLPVDTEVHLHVALENTGPGVAHKGIAILRNKTGRQIFLRKGRIEFEELAAASTEEIDFEFGVRSGDPVEQYELEMVFYDSYSGETLVKELKIGPAGSKAEPFPNGVRFAPPSIECALVEGAKGSPSPLVTDAPEVFMRGHVRSTTQNFKAWVTRVSLDSWTESPDKLYYKNSGGRSELSIVAPVRLKEGLNVVTLVARDRNGLETRRSLIIRRDVPGRLTASQTARPSGTAEEGVGRAGSR